MEELIKQTRQAEFNKIREKKPPRQTGSFNEDKKVKRGFPRPFSGRMGADYEAREMEFAAATAAAAFSIHSHEEEAQYQKKLREEFKASRTKIGNYQETIANLYRKFGGEIDLFSGKGKKFDRRAESSLRNLMVREDRRALFTIRKADAWEKSELEKILKRYEKMKFAILSWENKKKMKAKLRMERRKAALEHRRTLNLQHYQNKLERIDKIAGGAIAQLEQKRRKEESKLKEKANKIRTKGKVPVKYCFCF